ncbi:class I SAM-dependent methyltransferase [Neisseriaceae bacterium CLB008]|nr:methyltransferase domain-containing protein [Neisseriaceae bacterium]
MKNHTQVVTSQFGEQANAYLNSSVHAQGTEFAHLQSIVADQPQAHVLDLGCGAGHVSFHVAPLVAQVTAYDLANDMLTVVAQAAQEKGLSNITTRQGLAEQLPFADAQFDYVFSRYSAHHWQDVGQALREIKRVLKPGGQVVFIDVCAPGLPLLDTYLQTVEVLRDPSHVRDYSVAEWARLLGEAGLHVQQQHTQKLTLEFQSWVTRMRTPKVMQDAILALQQAMGKEVRDYFAIQPEGTFNTDVLVIQAQA